MHAIEGALRKSDRPATDVRQTGATDAPTAPEFSFVGVRCIDPAFRWHNNSIDVVLLRGTPLAPTAIQLQPRPKLPFPEVLLHGA